MTPASAFCSVHSPSRNTNTPSGWVLNPNASSASPTVANMATEGYKLHSLFSTVDEDTIKGGGLYMFRWL